MFGKWCERRCLARERRELARAMERAKDAHRRKKEEEGQAAEWRERFDREHPGWSEKLIKAQADFVAALNARDKAQARDQTTMDEEVPPKAEPEIVTITIFRGDDE